MHRIVPLILALGTCALGPSTGGTAHAALEAPDLIPPAVLGAPAAPDAPATPTPIVVPAPDRPAPAARRVLGPRVRPFELLAGDRVLLVGDGYLDAETRLGYLETRLVSEFPDRSFTVRTLLAPAHHPLVDPAQADSPDTAASAWLKPARTFDPTVVVAAFGLDASRAGTNALARFKTHYDALLDTLRKSDTNAVRFVLLTPPAAEPDPGAPAGTADRLNEERAAFAGIVREAATARGARVVPLFEWMRMDLARAAREAEARQVPPRRLTEDGSRLNAYGHHRLLLALEAGLLWRNNWRFGIMRQGELRPGQFGIQLSDVSRSDQYFRARTLEDRLPSPNLPDYLDLQPDTRPQCYIQIVGLKPGRYGLKVDGQPVGVAELRSEDASADGMRFRASLKPVSEVSEADWDRFEIVGVGPSWDQAEALRQTVVQKNALLAELAAPDDPPASAGSHARLAELERAIDQRKRPVNRVYEIVRVEPAATSPATSALPAAPPTPPKPRSAPADVPLPPGPKPEVR